MCDCDAGAPSSLPHQLAAHAARAWSLWKQQQSADRPLAYEQPELVAHVLVRAGKHRPADQPIVQSPQVPAQPRETDEDVALEAQRIEAEHALRAATLTAESIVEHAVDAAQRAGLDLAPPSDVPQVAVTGGENKEVRDK